MKLSVNGPGQCASRWMDVHCMFLFLAYGIKLKIEAEKYIDFCKSGFEIYTKLISMNTLIYIFQKICTYICISTKQYVHIFSLEFNFLMFFLRFNLLNFHCYKMPQPNFFAAVQTDGNKKTVLPVLSANFASKN